MKKVWDFIKKHKKIIIILAIVVALVVGGIYIASAVKKAKGLLAGMGNSATTEEIEKRDIVNSVTATGTIVAVDKRTVSSTVTGVKVKQLNVAVGDQVNKGDIICLLDGENLEQQLADAQIMLNADAGRSGIDVASSNRGLNEAIVSRDIAATRAEEDKNTAYHHAVDAGNEALEAENKYNSAVNDTKALKGEMEAAEAAYKKANKSKAKSEEQKNAIKSQMSLAENTFNSTLSQMEAYISSIDAKYPHIPAEGTDPEVPGEATYLNLSWNAGISTVDASDLSGLRLTNVYIGDNPDIQNTISMYIGDLESSQDEYLNLAASLDTPADKVNVDQLYAYYEKAKAAYESAVLQEESQKAAYEAKLKSVESMWESYNNVVRGADDSKRNNDSAVAARVDSVKNSQLGASTATLGDKRNIATLQEQIDGCIVTSSIGGIVTDVTVIEGENYMGGAIVTIENTSDYEVSALIDEYDIAKIKVDQEVIIKTNGTGTTEMKGKVKSVAPHATTTPGVSGVKYEVIISVLDKNENLRLDMTAKVEIICEKAANVISVATEAIQEDDDGNFFVEVLDSGSTIDTSTLMTNPDGVSKEDVEKLQSGEKTYESHNVTVTKGLVGDYYTEISGDGLEEGTKVVIPNEGVLADINEYMEQAGAAGGY